MTPENIEAIAMAMLHKKLPSDVSDIRRKSEWASKGKRYIRKVQDVVDAMELVCKGVAAPKKAKILRPEANFFGGEPGHSMSYHK